MKTEDSSKSYKSNGLNLIFFFLVQLYRLGMGTKLAICTIELKYGKQTAFFPFHYFPVTFSLYYPMVKKQNKKNVGLKHQNFNKKGLQMKNIKIMGPIFLKICLKVALLFQCQI